MMLRIVAGLTSSPEDLASVREPTGWPSVMYCAINERSRWRARASSCRDAAFMDLRRVRRARKRGRRRCNNKSAAMRFPCRASAWPAPTRVLAFGAFG